ncbi:acyl-CoA dehydrogenase family protein [bacterium]|nr:acyl-CoA dehydrogenase family protein [bacterium]
MPDFVSFDREQRNHPAREAFRTWEEDREEIMFCDPHLRHFVSCRTEKLNFRNAAALESMMPLVGKLTREYDNPRGEPYLDSVDRFGVRTENVVMHSAHREVGEILYNTGIVRAAKTPGSSFMQALLFYTLSHEGEVGHACPIACAIALTRALRRRGAAAEYEDMDRIAAVSYDSALRVGQLMTEVQGGSNVGGNEMIAYRNEDGSYRLFGEKFFCSVADADIFMVSARLDGAPGGTKGIGCFLMPRSINGEPNNFRIARLKRKIGTTSLPTGEFEFHGALACALGEPERGFEILAADILNTARWLNAVAGAGMMRSAYITASSYARYRVQFGKNIAFYSYVRARLADMKAEWLAALYAVWLVTDLDFLIDSGTANENEQYRHRLFVNAVKYVTAEECIRAIENGIEVLGGNGAIYDFSNLPRLLGDAHVYKLWEGTPGTLLSQIERDLGRFGPDALIAYANQLIDEALPNMQTVLQGLVFVGWNRTKSALYNMKNHPDSPDFSVTVRHFVRLTVITLMSMAAGRRLTSASVKDELLAAAELIAWKEFGGSFESGNTRPRIDRVLGLDV